MNKEEIVAMVPGKDLDILIAEIIFDKGDGAYILDYSTDITSAYKIVQNIINRNSDKLYYSFSMTYSSKGCQCELISSQRIRFDSGDCWWPEKHYITNAGTIMEAICKSVLIASLEENFK